MVLVIPNKVTNIHNKSTTFRVYDPNQAIGDISPTAVSQQAQAAPPKKKHGCGGVGQIIVAIVAIAVTAFIAPYAIAGVSNVITGATGAAALTSTTVGAAITAGTVSTAALAVGGAIGAVAGSVASQGVALATGLQSKFDWSGVALAALSGGIAGGLGGALPNSTFGGNAVLGGAVRGAAGNVITQGVSMVAGLQGKFDWSGVAVGGVVGASTAWAGGLTGIKALETAAPFTRAGFTYGAVTGVAGAVAGAATRSLLNGTDFGDNIRAVLPDVIASTIGNAVAGSLKSQSPRSSVAQARGPRPYQVASNDSSNAFGKFVSDFDKAQASTTVEELVVTGNPRSLFKDFITGKWNYLQSDLNRSFKNFTAATGLDRLMRDVNQQRIISSINAGYSTVKARAGRLLTETPNAFGAGTVRGANTLVNGVNATVAWSGRTYDLGRDLVGARLGDPGSALRLPQDIAASRGDIRAASSLIQALGSTTPGRIYRGVESSLSQTATSYKTAYKLDSVNGFSNKLAGDLGYGIVVNSPFLAAGPEAFGLGALEFRSITELGAVSLGRRVEGATVTLYRVDDAAFAPRIASDGSVPFVTTRFGGERALFVNFDQPERALDFARNNRRGNATITAVDVNASLLENLRTNSVLDTGSAARLNPTAPLRVDIYKAPDQFGLRTPEQIQMLRDAIKPGTVRIIDPGMLGN